MSQAPVLTNRELDIFRMCQQGRMQDAARMFGYQFYTVRQRYHDIKNRLADADKRLEDMPSDILVYILRWMHANQETLDQIIALSNEELYRRFRHRPRLLRFRGKFRRPPSI